MWTRYIDCIYYNLPSREVFNHFCHNYYLARCEIWKCFKAFHCWISSHVNVILYIIYYINYMYQQIYVEPT